MNNLKLVFSRYSYSIIAVAIFVSMLIPLSILSGFIFTEPFFIFHVTEASSFSFVLIIGVSVMSAIVIPMNVYRIKTLQKSTSKIGGSVIGSIIGASAGICSCGPIGFSIISTFGTVAGTAAAFLTNYEIPLRIGSIALLCLVYYTTTRSISSECKIS
ncbi:MAG: efflux RND transporter permease subunit [Candidatus Nitrosopelagicus sp.]|nr:efflux RND transporter permease subunit [Candidatus Nitrosopelagicus sp.]NWJ89761.1 hypothetical protein [Marine Group I thaumarchaeote]PXF28507.1 MAG: hypothetical protein CXX67_00060 [Nitrososphaerota archaeon]HIA09919.1 hypothetical protein [Candidatus Nitrosopelagicus sp.]HIA97363.1 hypothetical protein [Candidatus Nitrosopelagicus sp.]